MNTKVRGTSLEYMFVFLLNRKKAKEREFFSDLYFDILLNFKSFLRDYPTNTKRKIKLGFALFKKESLFESILSGSEDNEKEIGEFETLIYSILEHKNNRIIHMSKDKLLIRQGKNIVTVADEQVKRKADVFHSNVERNVKKKNQKTIDDSDNEQKIRSHYLYQYSKSYCDLVSERVDQNAVWPFTVPDVELKGYTVVDIPIKATKLCDIEPDKCNSFYCSNLIDFHTKFDVLEKGDVKRFVQQVLKTDDSITMVNKLDIVEKEGKKMLQLKFKKPIPKELDRKEFLFPAVCSDGITSAPFPKLFEKTIEPIFSTTQTN